MTQAQQTIKATGGFDIHPGRAGAVFERMLEDGRTVTVYPMTYDKGRVLLSEDDSSIYALDAWCYDSVPAAIAAVEEWDGEGEPQGWFRHPDSGRRRPDGDAEREYVNK